MPRQKLRKKNIVKAGERLFLAKGFNNTTVEEITTTAGISKGSFYTYFKSKDSLLEEIVRSTLDEILSKLESSFMKGKDVKKVLEDYINININLAKSYKSSIIVSLREAALFANTRENTLAEKIFTEVRSSINKFCASAFGKRDSETTTLLWGLTLALWIEVAFEERIPSVKNLAEELLFGILGVNK